MDVVVFEHFLWKACIPSIYKTIVEIKTKDLNCFRFVVKRSLGEDRVEKLRTI